MFDSKLIRTTFLFLVLAEILSFLAFTFPIFNTVCFFVILALVLIVSFKSLESGVLILLAELFLGDSGRFFSIELGAVSVSIRMGLFSVIMAVWLFGLLKNIISKKDLSPSLAFFKSKIKSYYLFLSLALVWGLVYGLSRGNSPALVYLDFNNWLYLLLVLPIFQVAKNKDFWKRVLSVLAAAVLAVALKTVIIYFFFGLNIKEIISPVYWWQRATAEAQFGRIGGNFFRILFISNIYALVLFFISFSPLSLLKEKTKTKSNFLWFLVFVSLFVVLFSFFRSYWAAGFLGFIVFLALLKKYFNLNFRKLIKQSLTAILVTLVAIVLIFGISQAALSLSMVLGSYSKEDQAVQKEIFTFGDVAVASRFNLLKPMFQKISSHPIIGSGFGTTITYKNEDPRYSAEPFTTYAFEWGYLDMIIETGLVGLVIFLLLIIKTLKQGLSLIKNSNDTKIKYLALGLVSGLFVFIAIHIFSPYLNHPLGLGYLVLVNAFIYKANEQKNFLHRG
ncbi:O-antigen ligase family protein [Candidatus Falkowbacteria bacterium]|nr:O-antigen ligase family protein [Candidatus Falkowbacteria bacterium]